MKKLTEIMKFVSTEKKKSRFSSLVSSAVFSFLIAFLFSTQLNGQITITVPNPSPEDVIQNVLLGTGVTASNITFNGSPVNATIPQNSVQKFNNTSGVFPLTDGVHMHTSGAGTIFDADLSAITTNNVTNGAIIEFDFVPDGDSLSFTYIFASAEYQSYTCSPYNDVFGFFISGPGISGPFTNNAINIAVVPNSNNIPVGINTVNSGYPSGGYPASNCSNADINWQSNAIYYTTGYNGVYNSSGQPFSSYSGSTVELAANATVSCGETYHIKLAISNVGDQAFNSGVFLKAGSFASTPTIDVVGASTTASAVSDSVMVEGCDEGSFCFIRPESTVSDTAIIHYQITGSATVGIDYTLGNIQQGDSIILMPGELEYCIDITPLTDNISEGLENVILSAYVINACNDTTFNSAQLWIADLPETPDPDPGNPFVVCFGDNGMLNGTPTSPANAVSWSVTGPGNVTFIPNNEQLNATISFDTPGEYTFFLTETNDTCELSGVNSVMVIYEKVELEVSNDTTVCENGEATLIATGSGSDFYLYHWDHTPSTSAEQIVYPLAQSFFTVYAESGNGCVSPPETINIDVLPPLQVISSPWQSICPGDSVVLWATASDGNGGPYNYVWTDPNGLVVAVGDTVVLFPTQTTIYTVTATDECETTPVTSTSEVVYDHIPDILFTVTDPALCPPATFELINHSDGSYIDEIYWNISDGQSFGLNDTIYVDLNKTGYYDVELVIVTPNGCRDSLTINGMLEVYPLPVADFTYSPRPLTPLDTDVQLENFSTGAAYYEWHIPGGIPSYSELKDPTTKYPLGEFGTYNVQLIVTSEVGCMDTVIKPIVILPEVEIFVPNTFTPNGDGLNDLWYVHLQGINIYNVTIEIFNRWGEQVWESHDITQGWDGTYGEGNRIVPSGVYVWKVSGADYHTDEKYQWQGHLTLIR